MCACGWGESLQSTSTQTHNHRPGVRTYTWGNTDPTFDVGVAGHPNTTTKLTTGRADVYVGHVPRSNLVSEEDKVAEAAFQTHVDAFSR